MRAIDLFAGCGGLTQGLTEAGFRVIVAIEKDSFAASTYSLNHSFPLLLQDDIRHVAVESVMRRVGLDTTELDLLAACPPCQGFSTVRTKNGRHQIADPRNSLTETVVEYARRLRPKCVLFENVRGAASAEQFLRMVHGLESLDYRCRWGVHDCAQYGVPQRRLRLILTAFPRYHPRFQFATQCKPITVRDAIGRLPGTDVSDDPLHQNRSRRSPRIKKLIEHIPRDGGSRGDLPDDLILDCHRRTDGFKDVYGRMSWSRPAPTITCGCINPSKGRFLHPEANRAITLREAALLQSFSAQYQFGDGTRMYDTAGLIGNAVPPAFVRIQATELREVLRTI